jgi:putative nucleotidyltransferase with HDIG domain
LLPLPVIVLASLILDKEGTVYAVGGCVRDRLTDREPKDIDLATDLSPETMLKLDDTGNDQWHVTCLPIGIEFGTVVCIIEFNNEPNVKHRIEVTTLRKDISTDGRHAEVSFSKDIKEDLERRDFTINAMAVNIGDPWEHDIIIDPFNGQEDLKNRIIRAVGDPEKRFQEDYLRMVRACRFTGYGDGFTIEPRTWTAIAKYKHELLKHVSVERIREELIKMMMTPHPDKCINALKNTGLLKHVIPPLYDCVGVEQNKFHAETVYEHCVAVCKHLPADKPILRLAGLLHDIGKPITKDGDGANCSFHNHEIKGARIAYNFMRDYLRFSNEDCEYISLIVRYHMFHFDLDSKKKTVKRWLRKTKGLHKDLFILRMADRAGNKAKTGRPLVTTYMTDLMAKIKEIEEWEEPMSVLDLRISGANLIEMGYKPGPQFGIILRALLEKVDDDSSLNETKKLEELAKELFRG